MRWSRLYQGLSTGSISFVSAKFSGFASHCNSPSSEDSVASVSTYPANNPSEDRCISWHNSTSTASVVGVFDGHGGAQCANYCQQNILPILERSSILDENFDISDIETQRRVVSCFQELEDGYLKSIKDAYKLGFGKVSSVGCCALIAVRKGQDLLIANCGDCRAVLAKKITQDDGNSFRAITCTNDHNCRRPFEQIKLRMQHPGENDVYVCKPNNPNACYVKKRLQLTRSIGDAYLKYPEFNAPAGLHRSSGRHIPEPYTPPYVSHVPELHYIKLSEEDKFLILATDGVWDFLTDRLAVEIVASCDEHSKAASILVEKTLESAALENGITIDDLKEIPVGSSRRQRHDDTSVVILNLASTSTS